MVSETTVASASRPAVFKITDWIEARARLLLVLLIAGYTIVVTTAAIRKFQRYGMGYDLALIQQVIWNTLHGRPFETFAYDFTDNLLGTDSFFVLLVLLPFYAIWPNPASLLAAQTVIVATSAIPVYLLARDYLGRRWAAVALAAIYLAYLPVMWGNLYEIRERVMAMAWILWLLLCLERGWYRRMLIPLALALSCRLDTTIGIAAIGIYALLLRNRRWTTAHASSPDGQPLRLPGPIPWRFGATLIAAAVLWYLFVTQVMLPSLATRPSYMFLEHYSHLGKTPAEIVVHVVTHPIPMLQLVMTSARLWYLLGMFLPLAFLPLLDWRLLLAMLPLYGLNLLSLRKIQWDVYHHYQGLIVPLMILATIFALVRLARRRLFGRSTLEYAIGAMLLCTLVSQALFENELTRIFKRWQPTEREIAANTLVRQVPDDAAVAAGNLLAPHLPPRREIYLVPGGNFYYAADPFGQSDYALVDMQRDDERQATEAAIAAGGWCRIDEEAGYLLLKKQPGATGEVCAPRP